MSRGLLLILTGASSVGKNKIRDLLLKDQELNLFYSVSMTTRKPKENEKDGEDYYFVSHGAFAQAIRDKEMLEFTEFNGYYYGTPKNQVEFLLKNGKNVLIEVEAQGVGQIKLNYPEAIAIFVRPESMEELKKQILLRYADDNASAERRIEKASMEMELEPLFKYVVENTDENVAVEKIKEAIHNHKA